MMLAAHIKLDELAIDMHIMEGFLNAPIIHLLNKLYERGFYKRLQLYLVNILNQETVDRLATVSGLVKLCANVRSVAVRLSALKDLEEISWFKSDDIADLKILASNCINLERISFDSASIEDIMPLIRQAVELQRIKLDCIDDGMYFSEHTNVLDLYALSRERNNCQTHVKRLCTSTKRFIWPRNGR